MRPIKFRGKRLHNGDWVFGHYYTIEDKGKINHYIKPDGVSLLVDGSTIGQFTGVYDTKGLEVYEGDIIIADIYVNYISSYRIRGLVNFDNFCFVITLLNSNLRGSNIGIMRLSNITIIGNKYDNPNLLEFDHEEN